ncbi:MAG TPA: tRNA 2-thiouridine(34) synthase MnmA, partial [Candidatus Paceibacterota bacterium]|nr:tRNA 2-thiouridine(34) synthase MnmA [Candidatus Paceibacterota bacterium]
MPSFRRASSRKAFVGLSGGVDSAVSAALLKREGFDVTGVFIRIQIPGYPCPAARDRIEAMRVAAHLDIPFLEVDLSAEYAREVFAPSIDEFKKGHTPNPDALCNEKIKFGVFFDFCRKQGADVVATGHYAQLRDDLLYKGADQAKDQSYFLWAVGQGALRYTRFPVGHLQKPEVRRLAKKFGLPNAVRPDSQGLCFLGDISLGDMLERELAPRPGRVLNESGEIVGMHEGAMLYTLGQRHGFSLSHETPDAPPMYVVAKDAKRNTITISPQKFPQGVSKTILKLASVNWIGECPPGLCEARFRYRQALMPAELQNGGMLAVLHEPHYVPAGQSLVLYRGERCLGGGV